MKKVLNTFLDPDGIKIKEIRSNDIYSAKSFTYIDDDIYFINTILIIDNHRILTVSIINDLENIRIFLNYYGEYLDNKKILSLVQKTQPLIEEKINQIQLVNEQRKRINEKMKETLGKDILSQEKELEKLKNKIKKGMDEIDYFTHLKKEILKSVSKT